MSFERTRIIFVGLLLCKVDPQIWTGCFLVFCKSGNWAEYIHSIFTVYSYWIVALRIRGFGDAIYGGGERQDYEVRILNAQRIQNALGRIRVESRQDFISYAASPLVRPFASDPYCN